MINPLSLLTGKIGLYAALGVMVLSMGTCTVATLGLKGELRATNKQLSSTSATLKTTQGELAQCNLNRTTLQSGIDAANEIVQRQAQEAELAKAEGDRRLQAALKLAQTYKNRAVKIAEAKPSSPDMCVAAQSLIVQTLGEERQ